MKKDPSHSVPQARTESADDIYLRMKTHLLALQALVESIDPTILSKAGLQALLSFRGLSETPESRSLRYLSYLMTLAAGAIGSNDGERILHGIHQGDLHEMALHIDQCRTYIDILLRDKVEYAQKAIERSANIEGENLRRLRIDTYDLSKHANIDAFTDKRYNYYDLNTEDTSSEFNAASYLSDEMVPADVADAMHSTLLATGEPVSERSLSMLVRFFKKIQDIASSPPGVTQLFPTERFADRPTDVDPITFLKTRWGDAIEAGATQQAVSDTDPDLLPGVKAYEHELKQQGKRVPKFKWPRIKPKLEATLADPQAYIKKKREQKRDQMARWRAKNSL